MSDDPILLRAALKWALEHGVRATVYSSTTHFHDAGCGCCSGSIEPEPEFDALVREIRRELIAGAK